MPGPLRVWESGDRIPTQKHFLTVLSKGNVGDKLDSRFPATRGAIPFLSIRTHAWSYNPGVILFFL